MDRPLTLPERLVRCPRCAAAAGEPCQSGGGETPALPHHKRVEAARRVARSHRR